MYLLWFNIINSFSLNSLDAYEKNPLRWLNEKEEWLGGILESIEFIFKKVLRFGK